MEYSQLIAVAESNLKAKNALNNYSVGEGIYARRGAETNHVGLYNQQYYERFGFKFRLIDSQAASTEIKLFGRTFKTPIFTGALSGMTEITDNPLVKIAAGVKDSGSLMGLGIITAQQLHEVMEVGVPTFRIVKPFLDIEEMVKELKEAEAAGVIAVGTDITFFYGGKRGDRTYAPKPMGPKTLDQLKALVGATRLPFVVKGVLSPEDAEKALAAGAGAIVVSNHGGQVIDYAAHPLEVLPEIKKVIGNKIPILVDSGIRRGSDVMKALALGADAVLAGWAMAMGLAADGSQGVSEMLNTLTAELQRIMSVTGCKQLADIDKKALIERDYFIRR